jgi:hypothetical protein
MTPDRLALDEIAAREAMLAAPDDSLEAAYDAWLRSRRAIEAEIRRTGRVLEHAGPDRYVVYSLGYFDSLHRRTIRHGRYRCSRSSTASSSSMSS